MQCHQQRPTTTSDSSFANNFSSSHSNETMSAWNRLLPPEKYAPFDGERHDSNEMANRFAYFAEMQHHLCVANYSTICEARYSATSASATENGKQLTTKDNDEDDDSQLHEKLWAVRGCLEMKYLWDEFNELGTEMIVTKAGRYFSVCDLIKTH